MPKPDPKDPSARLAGILTASGLTLSIAESCTGGLASDIITTTPGSSAYFLGAIIAYDNNVKTKLLGVRPETLERYGAVSVEAAKEMATGVKKALSSDVAISITGIAGPGGGGEVKPVGLVYIGVVTNGDVTVKELRLSGDRSTIKRTAAREALQILAEALGKR
ncbi:MAG: CinA family protein [Thermodesulfobacteriota bacterium]